MWERVTWHIFFSLLLEFDDFLTSPGYPLSCPIPRGVHGHEIQLRIRLLFNPHSQLEECQGIDLTRVDQRGNDVLLTQRLIGTPGSWGAPLKPQGFKQRHR